MYAAKDGPAQTIGCVIRVDTSGRRGGKTGELPLETVVELVARRLSDLPQLRRRLVGRGRWRRPGWLPADGVDARRHVDECRVSESRQPATVTAAVEEFFAVPPPLPGPPWQLRIVRDPGGDTLLAVKLHHALGDGLAVTTSLMRLLADEPLQGSALPHRPDSNGKGRSGRWRVPRTALVAARGLGSLARRGISPATPANGLPPPSPGQPARYRLAELDAGKVAAAARAYQVSSSTLLVAVVAEALHRILGGSGANGRPGQWLPAMVPLVLRTTGPDGTPRGSGNPAIHAALEQLQPHP